MAPQRTQVRAEPLVGGADQEVGAARADVDREVRRVVDGIDVEQGADQGETFASWSRPVTTISSPGVHIDAMERLMWNVSVVML